MSPNVRPGLAAPYRPAAPSIVISQEHLAHSDPHSKGLSSEHVDFISSPSLGDTKSLAACLATPSEAVPENEAGARGRLVATSSLRGTVVFQLQEEVTQCVDRWSDWVRRIRRKRRMDHVQGILALFSSGGNAAAAVISK